MPFEGKSVLVAVQPVTVALCLTVLAVAGGRLGMDFHGMRWRCPT